MAPTRTLSSLVLLVLAPLVTLCLATTVTTATTPTTLSTRSTVVSSSSPATISFHLRSSVALSRGGTWFYNPPSTSTALAEPAWFSGPGVSSVTPTPTPTPTPAPTPSPAPAPGAPVDPVAQVDALRKELAELRSANDQLQKDVADARADAVKINVQLGKCLEGPQIVETCSEQGLLDVVNDCQASIEKWRSRFENARCVY